MLDNADCKECDGNGWRDDGDGNLVACYFGPGEWLSPPTLAPVASERSERPTLKLPLLRSADICHHGNECPECGRGDDATELDAAYALIEYLEKELDMLRRHDVTNAPEGAHNGI